MNSLSLATKGVIVNSAESLATKGVIYRKGFVERVLSTFRASLNDASVWFGRLRGRKVMPGRPSDASGDIDIYEGNK